MTSTEQLPAGLRLRVGQVTVLLGTDEARRGIVQLLDEATARTGAGPGGRATVCRLSAGCGDDATQRCAALRALALDRPSLLIADRITDGLDGPSRRTVLGELALVAGAGVAVLADDADPVAALAVAGHALRVGPQGQLTSEAPDALPSFD